MYYVIRDWLLKEEPAVVEKTIVAEIRHCDLRVDNKHH